MILVDLKWNSFVQIDPPIPENPEICDEAEDLAMNCIYL